MNILWIYNRPLEPEAGGTERITSLVAKGLLRSGHNCFGMLVFDEHYDVLSYNGQCISDLYDFLKEYKIDIVINQIAYTKWLLDSFLNKGGNKWKQEGGRIISCLHFDPKNPSLLYLLKGKSDKRMIDRVNILKAFLLYKYYEVKQEQREGDIYNYIYENSDIFVTLSSTHFPYLHKVMKRNEYSRLVAINNPLTFDDISGLEILSQKKKVVLVCARMSEYHKRISIVLKAWEILQKKGITDWNLVLLGDGPDLDSYKTYVQMNRIRNVVFEGQQSPESYYRAASILLLTSSAEGWGLTITEGLQRGVVPVVMNSSSVFSEIIEDKQNGFLTPDGELNKFADQIEQLISNPQLLIQMQENALKSAEKFSLEKTMIKWENILCF